MITDNKRFADRQPAENSLRQVDGGHATYMLTSDGIVNSWNPGAQRYTGYLADEIIGQNFSIFLEQKDQKDGLPARILQTAKAKGSHEYEGGRVRKDGSTIWTCVTIDQILDHTGQLVGYVEIMRDISERKAEQEALRESEQRFRLLVEGVTDHAIYMLSPAGEITNWNAGAQRIKGYSSDEVIGSNFSRFYTPEDQANNVPMKALGIALNEGKFESEGWRVRKDGTRFWAQVVIDVLHDDKGAHIGFAKITRDISESRKTAEMLERARVTLFNSQKMESIGKLTGGIAHDFNNLLSVVVSGLELLSREVHSPNGARLLESMKRAATRGATLTQQLLAFARQQPLRQDRYNINSLIGGIEAILRRSCRESVRLDVITAPDLRLVMLDAPQFEATMLNLVVNAQDAMSAPGSISIRTENAVLNDYFKVGDLQPGTYVKVSVIDSGTGMNPEVVAHAFEPFFTTKEIGKGTGMGLSQVYGFVKQSGGDVVVDSVVGKGTTISLYLPALAASAPFTLETVRRSGAEKVLIVEDEPDVLSVAVEIFRNMEYEVLTASNGLDAIDILKQTRDINILFTDVVMPNGMSGIELARFTQKLCPDVKIILASGYLQAALKAEHGNLDDLTFISKPYRWSELAKKLRSVA